MSTDEVYAKLMRAVECAREKGYTVKPGAWGVEGVDEDGDLLDEWTAYNTNVCPMGAVLICTQPNINQDIMEAATRQLGVEPGFVSCFIDGFDGQPMQEDFNEAGFFLGQRFRQELGYD